MCDTNNDNDLINQNECDAELQAMELDGQTEIDGNFSKHIGCGSKFNRRLADFVLTTDEDKLLYLKQYNCNPPPLFILTISLAELVVFIYYGVKAEYKQWITISSGLAKSPLIYDPWKREEVWRFVSYMFLHAGIEHIMGNVVLQLMVGIMLEMVHKSLRVSIVYMSGVLAGSLSSSIFDPFVFLVGASGGVYALLGGYLSNVIMNWSKLAFNGLHLLLILAIAIVDIGFSLYRRIAVMDDDTPQVSLAAHFAGGLAGITIGYVVFSNFNKSLISDTKMWVCLIAYLFACGFAVLWNLFLSPVGTV
uniref:Rhomboid-related protein 2 n=1 Tax=Phallusia mammillata TaxID=59560 RepID=A0A6F9DRN4_9ASCI|nr:rhomboid-related protein 2-like [Phallusia mammillata]